MEERIKEYCEAEGVYSTDPTKLKSVLLAWKNVWKENNNRLDILKKKGRSSVECEYKKVKIEEGICTLCLERCENFKTIDGNTKNILDMLVPEVDFTAIQEPMICKNCEEALTKCFDFKATCLHIYDYIVQFRNKDNVKLDLKDIYLSKNASGTLILEDQDICAFCMGLVNSCSAIPLDVEEKDTILEKMIGRCLLELDLKIIKKPVICASCHESLKRWFHFVVNCLHVGENIKKCYPHIQLTIGDVTTNEVHGNLTGIIQVGKFCEDRKNCDEEEIGNGGNTVKFENIFLDDSKDALKDIENRNKSFKKINDQEINNDRQFTPRDTLICAGDNNKLGSIKIEDVFCGDNETKNEEEKLVKMEEQTILFNEEIEIKTDEHDFNRFDNVLSQLEVARKLHERDQSYPYIKQDSSHVTMYKCDTCSYEAKYKSSIQKHLKMNSSKTTIHKCDSCSFQTKFKNCFRRHSLKHDDPSQITLYKCDSCSYQTRVKCNFNRHLEVHKNPLEVAIYKCNYCSYQTKYKSSIKAHLVLDPSGVTMQKCESCSFETKYKNCLRRHSLQHEDHSKKMYKCGSCLYQTKVKCNLSRHLEAHKDPSEVTMYKSSIKINLALNPSEETMYKCGFCSFQTTYKKCFRQHSLQHEDCSKITMYTCDSCSFQTKSKCNLSRHLLVHRGSSEVTMYKCYYCSFQTKHKGNLKDHLLAHKDSSEVTMYKCDYCSYQAKYKSYLKKHLLRHNLSEVTMYKCDSCSYQTKYKRHLKAHFRLYKGPLERTKYKCMFCSFEMKYKRCLKNHLRTHNSSDATNIYKFISDKS